MSKLDPERQFLEELKLLSFDFGIHFGLSFDIMGSRIHNLRIVNISKSGIENFPFHSLLLSNLKSLFIDRSPEISKLPKKVCLLTELIEFQIDLSSIEDLPKCFSKLTKLEKLTISRSRAMKNIPRVI